jgi:COP9 signalosome complex subunit 6
VLAGQTKKDHDAIRALSALVASLPASEHLEFRQEFDTVCAFSADQTGVLIELDVGI